MIPLALVFFLKILRVAQLVKNLPANAGDTRDAGFIPGIREIPWSRKWQPTPVFSAGKSHGQRSVVGCSPQGRKESYTTEQARARAHTHTHTPTHPHTPPPVETDRLKVPGSNNSKKKLTDYLMNVYLL